MGRIPSFLLVASTLPITASAEQVTVTGQHICRVLADADGILRTLRIHNEAAGRTLRVAGPEFLITWGQGKRATSDDFLLRELKARNGGAVAHLECKALGLAAEITYTVSGDLPWLYKQIRFTNTDTASFLLRTVEVEHLSVMDETVTYAVNPEFPSLADWGQPVYTESLWFGVEFSATRSSATRDGVIFLRHHPGIELAAGDSYTSKRAVLGVASPGKVADAFMDYVATLTPRPNPPRMRLYWEGFRVINPPDYAGQGLEMIKYARKLKGLTGFTFDAWDYAAGFNMFRPDALYVPTEPDIWDRTVPTLKSLGTPLGLWCSFSGIYDALNHTWGKTQGYELQHDQAYCLAGPRYYKAIKSRLEEVVRKYRMGSLDFDGMFWGQGFGCNVPGHGHLTCKGPEEGVFGTERVVENKMAIFHCLRQINPDIILDLFVCNEWASPWWLTELDGVHTVKGDTLGCDIPSPWLRDELITVRDIQVFDEHRRLRRQFPLWAEDLYGTQVRKDHLIDDLTVTGEAMAHRWEDEYVMALPGRGAITANLMCSDLAVLDRSCGGLKFLGEVANWVRANERIYRDFRLLGGEPAQWQPYGYAHADAKGRVVVALRNPWIEPRVFRLALDESIGLAPSPGEFFVNVAYPCRKTMAPAKFGQSVDIPLQDYQVMLLEVRSQSRQFEGVSSARRWQVNEAGELLTYDEAPLDTLPAGRLIVTSEAAGLRIAGEVLVPDGRVRGQLQLMIRPVHGDIAPPVVTIKGQSADVAFHHRARKGQPAADAWALIDLPQGRSRIDATLPTRGKVRLGAWVVATYALEAKTAGSRLENQEALFPVFAPHEDRRVATVLAVDEYALPAPRQ